MGPFLDQARPSKAGSSRVIRIRPTQQPGWNKNKSVVTGRCRRRETDACWRPPEGQGEWPETLVLQRPSCDYPVGCICIRARLRGSNGSRECLQSKAQLRSRCSDHSHFRTDLKQSCGSWGGSSAGSACRPSLSAAANKQKHNTSSPAVGSTPRRCTCGITRGQRSRGVV